ncbi:ABC transporter ATP-binding protein [Rhizobiales bacterium L72]|uniref:ABC transporter ATP-binding protein n=2 Tax=Propylenella binzhouense TaxID=2555902 RepID=A0A964T1U7_9HYPH|nr:ABC transporter ATP-binding protein [Propylenella binzhouense]
MALNGTPAADTPLLEVRTLSVAYGRKAVALNAVNLTVPKAGVVALLGANGAGKTTLIRTVSGLIRLHNGAITGGEVLLEGKSIAGLSADRIVRLGMGQVPEGRLVFKNLTVEENLQVGGAILPRATLAERLDAVYDLFPRLAERKDQAAGLMSGGEQQMLALGRALAASPRVLLIDELSLGLAPLIVGAIYQQLKKIREHFGTALLIVEQNARLALGICDYAYVLERGEIVLAGPAELVAASERMHESYLGARAERQAAAG